MTRRKNETAEAYNRRQRERYRKRADEVSARRRARYAEDPELHRERAREYRASRPEAVERAHRLAQLAEARRKLASRIAEENRPTKRGQRKTP